MENQDWSIQDMSNLDRSSQGQVRTDQVKLGQVISMWDRSSQVTTLYSNLLPNSTSVVKLHSDLRILTQLQLVGVGVDFVFPLEEGRRSNPHLAFSRRNDPTCLIFGDCLVGVWRVYGNCLEGV